VAVLLEKLGLPAWSELVTSNYGTTAHGYSDGRSESWVSLTTPTSSPDQTQSLFSVISTTLSEPELKSEVTVVFTFQPVRTYDSDLTPTVSYAISELTTDWSTSSG
jgi:hypothetical protein